MAPQPGIANLAHPCKFHDNVWPAKYQPWSGTFKETIVGPLSLVTMWKIANEISMRALILRIKKQNKTRLGRCHLITRLANLPEFDENRMRVGR